MNRALVSIGAALALIGGIVLLAVLFGSPAIGESHAIDQATPNGQLPDDHELGRIAG